MRSSRLFFLAFSVAQWLPSSALDAPDLKVQLGYYATDWAIYYKNLVWINDPQSFPSGGWELSVEIEGYSLGHPDVNNTATNGLFQCLYLCLKSATGWRHILKPDASMVTEDNGCGYGGAFCVLKDQNADVVGLERFVLGYYKDPDDDDNLEPASWNDFTFLQPESRVVGTSSFVPGGTFAGPGPKVSLLGPSEWTVEVTFYAKKVAAATCLGGFYPDSDGSCKACPPGKFRTIEFREDNLKCMSCPPNSGKSLVDDNIEAAVDVASCVCDDGNVRSAEFDPLRGTATPEGASDAFYCLRCKAGMYGVQQACMNCTAGSYTNSEAATECIKCSPGSYRKEEGMESCLPCAQGKSVGGTGQQECVTCNPGRFADAEGKDQCDTCLRGSFAEMAGATICSLCPALQTTKASDSRFASDCKCMQGTYLDNATNTCIKCLEGMSCDGVDGFGVSIPSQLAGYQVNGKSAPFLVFKCQSESACPAGLPETCAEGIESSSVACSECEESYYRIRGACYSCGGGLGLLLVIFIIFLMFTICMVMYYFVNSSVTSKASIGVTLTASVGMMILLFQILAVFAQISLDGASTWGDIVSFFDLFTFDLSFFRISCLLRPSSSAWEYANRLIIPLVFCALYYVCFLASKLTGVCRESRRWTFPRTCNTVCTMMQAFYLSLVILAIVPFNCYEHPKQTAGDQPSSVVAFPDVICGEGDHPMIIAVGVVALLLYGGCFLGICIFMNMKAPALSARSPLFLQYSRFLVNRFRPTRWYWGSFLHFRSLSLAILPVLAQGVPTLQYVIIGMVLLVSLLVQCVYRPWKSAELNILETIVLLASLCLTFLSFGLCPAPSGSMQKAFMYLLTGTFFFTIVAIVFFFACVVRLAYGNSVVNARAKIVSESLHPTILSLAIIPEDEQLKFIQELSWVELQSVFDFVDVFGPCLETSRDLTSKIAVERPEVNSLRKMYSEIRTKSTLSATGSKTLETTANAQNDPVPGAKDIEVRENALEAPANADHYIDVIEEPNLGNGSGTKLEESPHALRDLSNQDGQSVVQPVRDFIESKSEEREPSQVSAKVLLII